MLKCAKLKIFGRVQGVFFRDFTQEKANDLGVRGWVRNAPDGTVEAIIEGNQPALDSMIAWCHKGSPSSQVEKVEVEWVEPEGSEGFEVRY
jgi:acylphosphatase